MRCRRWCRDDPLAAASAELPFRSVVGDADRAERRLGRFPQQGTEILRRAGREQRCCAQHGRRGRFGGVPLQYRRGKWSCLNGSRWPFAAGLLSAAGPPGPEEVDHPKKSPQLRQKSTFKRLSDPQRPQRVPDMSHPLFSHVPSSSPSDGWRCDANCHCGITIAVLCKNNDDSLGEDGR